MRRFLLILSVLLLIVLISTGIYQKINRSLETERDNKIGLKGFNCETLLIHVTKWDASTHFGACIS